MDFDIKKEVKNFYGNIAQKVQEDTHSTCSCCQEISRAERNYAGQNLDDLPKEAIDASLGCAKAYVKTYDDKNRCLCLLDPAGYCYGSAGGSLQYVICLGAGKSCRIQKPVQLAVVFTAAWRSAYRFFVSGGEDYRGQRNEKGLPCRWAEASEM